MKTIKIAGSQRELFAAFKNAHAFCAPAKDGRPAMPSDFARRTGLTEHQALILCVIEGPRMQAHIPDEDRATACASLLRDIADGALPGHALHRVRERFVK